MVNDKSRKVVGLNCYENGEDESAPEIFKVDPEVERIAVERIEELRASRDAAKYDAAMEAFDKVAKEFAGKSVPDLGDGALIDAAIEAARSGASTGEMMGVLKDALGWGPPHEY